jgi:hypothetical protein
MNGLEIPTYAMINTVMEIFGSMWIRAFWLVERLVRMRKS